MKTVEVLFLVSQNERKILDVFLHDPETDRVLRESVDTFMYRTVLPHIERLELRQISVADERFSEEMWYLRSVPYNNTCTSASYSIAFEHMFEVATGYYSPVTPTAFPQDEHIINSAVIFPCLTQTGEIYKQTMLLAPRHSQCFSRAATSKLHYDKTRVRQGFWTDKDRFLDRVEAKRLALANGQLLNDNGSAELYSEDLW